MNKPNPTSKQPKDQSFLDMPESEQKEILTQAAKESNQAQKELVDQSTSRDRCTNVYCYLPNKGGRCGMKHDPGIERQLASSQRELLEKINAIVDGTPGFSCSHSSHRSVIYYKDLKSQLSPPLSGQAGEEKGTE